MPSLQRIISSSTGLKITYVGFAAYALHTLAKFYLPQPHSPSPLSTLILVISFLGQLGLMAALLSMIATGTRGIRRVGLKSWWSLWALLGMAPFIAIAIAILSFSMLVNSEKPFLNSVARKDNLQVLEKKIEEMKAKKADPKLISKISKIYASEAYLYEGKIVEYIDENGSLSKYQPTEQEIQQRRDWKDMPQKIEEAQKSRFFEVGILFAIPLLTVAASILIPMKKTI